ncbi:hypothetical protein I553_2025 [Mycobacterium xenopi 4042]|uniref:Uncharacterized protein n=1 Tax=Mycobacterium xenopi 4042 TaxID=1299334 RepID=X8DJP9_MYCXE|nr:hypothetical protein I553_2025 [Mycobacterium xenopi 4042]
MMHYRLGQGSDGPACSSTKTTSSSRGSGKLSSTPPHIPD